MVKKGLKNITKQIIEKINEKERLKYQYMPETEKEEIRERSRDRYYRMKSKQYKR